MRIFELEHRVGYAETDAMGIVHHSNYLRWFEMGRVEMMREVGYPYAELEKMGVWIPVISAECQYKVPAVFDDIVVIRTWMEKIKGVSIFMKYEVVKKETGEVCVTGTTGHAVTDPDMKPLRLKRQFPKMYEEWAALADDSKIDTVIFDMDGTILDTLDDLKDAVNHAMEAMGHPAHSREEIRTFVGNGVELLIRRALPEGYDEREVAPALSEFKKFYAVHGNDNTKPYDGIKELLSELHKRGIKIAVLSNKYDAAVAELADSYFPGSFDVTYGEREGVPRKPEPDAVFAIIKEFKTDAAHTLYIGDSEVDMQTGKNAGVTTVGVTWGFRSVETLKENGADNIIDAPSELLKLL